MPLSTLSSRGLLSYSTAPKGDHSSPQDSTGNTKRIAGNFFGAVPLGISRPVGSQQQHSYLPHAALRAIALVPQF